MFRSGKFRAGVSLNVPVSSKHSHNLCRIYDNHDVPHSGLFFVPTLPLFKAGTGTSFTVV